METFLLTVKVVAVLLFYMAIGFIVGKKKWVGKGAAKTLAFLLTFVIMPLYSVANLSKNVSIEKISFYIELFLAGIVFMAVSLALCIPLSKLFAKKGYSRNIYKYLIFTSNMGYFGYPLVQEIYGDVMLSMYMIFVLPLSLVISTYGYLILTDTSEAIAAEQGMLSKDQRKKDLLKRVFSVPIVATFISIAIGLLPIELPEIFYDFLSPASECMRAIAMILAGLVLSEMSVKTLFSSKKAYFLCVLRLIVYPIVFGGIAYAVCLAGLPKEIFIFTVCVAAMPAGLNVVVYPEAVGLSGQEGAQACFISYLMVVITLPLVFLAMSAL